MTSLISALISIAPDDAHFTALMSVIGVLGAAVISGFFLLLSRGNENRRRIDTTMQAAQQAAEQTTNNHDTNLRDDLTYVQKTVESHDDRFNTIDRRIGNVDERIGALGQMIGRLLTYNGVDEDTQTTKSIRILKEVENGHPSKDA